MKSVNQYVMKDSGVQWIGEVPEHWEVCRVKDLFMLTTGGTPKDFDQLNDEEDTIDWYTPIDIKEDANELFTSKRKLSLALSQKNNIRIFPAHSLLFSGIGNVGKIGYLNNSGYANQQLTALMPKQGYSKYYYYFLAAFKDPIKDNAFYTVVPIVNNSYISAIPIALPPLSEQRAIADWLDAKCADIDAAIELQQRMIDKLKAYKTAVIHQAVTKGLDKNANLKDSGVQWIGEVPEHWEVCKIKNICTYVNRGCAPNYVENGTYYAMNQATFSKGFLDYSSLKFTTENRKSAQVLKQDILLASTGGGILGKVFYYNEESDLFYADSHVTILRVNKRTNDSRYLFYNLAIKYDLINALLAKGSTNQTELQRDLLKNHYIQCPPLTEQCAIADWLDAKCADIDATIALKEQKQEKLKTYKKTIIFEYVTGKKQVANINKQL